MRVLTYYRRNRHGIEARWRGYGFAWRSGVASGYRFFTVIGPHDVSLWERDDWATLYDFIEQAY